MPTRPTSLRAVMPLLALTLPMWIPLSGCKPEREEPMRRFQVRGADLQHGRKLMAQYQCGSCHVVPEVAAAGSPIAPTLEAFGKRAYIAGQLPNTPDNLQRWLLDPPAEVPGTAMPKLGLSEDDARDIAGYLMSLK